MDDVKIWVVKFCIDDIGISGMSILLLGVYLEFVLGESKEIFE